MVAATSGHLPTDPKQKKRIRQILMVRGLASYMNDTKWRELRQGVETLPFPPAYQIKRLDADAPEPRELEHAPAHFGDWGRSREGSLGIQIEWRRIAPRYSQPVGGLVAPVVQDCSRELVALLKRLRLPFVEQDGFILLYGHGPAIDFESA